MAGEATTKRHEEHIGLILVHGIGEHRRFQHLEGEMRLLLQAIIRRAVTLEGRDADESKNVTVEIAGGGVSALHADQDSWSTESGAPVRVVVREDGVTKHVHVHEVWWADVNEPYSLMKQIRFWAWGLSVWNVAERPKFDLPEAQNTMALPQFPPKEQKSLLWLRMRLFGVCNTFAMAGFSLGALVFFAKRLLSFQAPDIVQIFVNYIGAVKLYSQRRRSDGGFLDAYTEPPRASIRRRMIRTIADAALANYDRWYVVAHSLGSVVAFNGLMENAQALPNYLAESQFRELTQGVRDRKNPGTMTGPALAGKARGPQDYVGKTNEMLPARPIWLKDQDVVYRDRLFGRFRGVLTYGSPLDKFAAIWPPRVPINRIEEGVAVDQVDPRRPDEPRRKREWINVYDPTDPVSANLDAFHKPDNARENVVLEPSNYAYASHWLLLYSHLRYFDRAKDRTGLADRLVDWILTGDNFAKPPGTPNRLWLNPAGGWFKLRKIGAGVVWLLIYLLLTLLGALSLPLWRSLVVDGGGAVASAIGSVWRDTFGVENGAPSRFNTFVSSVVQGIWEGVTSFLEWVKGCAAWIDTPLSFVIAKLQLPNFVGDMIRLSVYVGVITFVAGWILRYRTATAPPPAAAPGSIPVGTTFQPRPMESEKGDPLGA